MIISHEHRYLFIEIPLTGSYSIRHELCNYYDGTAILHKHATIPEFHQIANAVEKSYFVFATVRNPLDKIVSLFFKYKTDHKGTFSDTESTSTFKADYSDVRKYEVINQSNMCFAEYFRRYCRRPYGDLIDTSGDNINFVIRFEHLQDDFSQVLRILGIKQARSLPRSNKTHGRNADWRSYYTPDIIEQAKSVCGPFMRKWNYEFPADWGEYRPSRIDQTKYDALNLIRNIYLIHFRYSSRPYAKFVRSLRAHFL